MEIVKIKKKQDFQRTLKTQDFQKETHLEDLLQAAEILKVFYGWRSFNQLVKTEAKAHGYDENF